MSALNRLETVFSRGFSLGWLDGTHPHRLVSGVRTSHRGIKAGVVIEVRRDAAVVLLSDTVRCGDGLVFENEENPAHSQGGRVFEIFRRRESVKEAEAGAKVLLTFANHAIDSHYVTKNQQVWKTDDPRRQKEIQKGLQKKGTVLYRPVALQLRIEAETGKYLHLTVCDSLGGQLTLTGGQILDRAQKHFLTETTLYEQFSRLGGTVYCLDSLTAEINGAPMVPLSVLGHLRREMISALDAEHSRTKTYRIEKDALKTIRRENEQYGNTDIADL
ncbi:MAG: DUF3656 domain-containing protein [Planctomycetaceae bacterium]|nr:DUF3656 domain-containing protein [Planctomycetaceae bacterium]